MSYEFSARIKCDCSWRYCAEEIEVVSKRPISVSALVREARNNGWGVTQHSKDKARLHDLQVWSFHCRYCRD
jgi:hypothetical protein